MNIFLPEAPAQLLLTSHKSQLQTVPHVLACRLTMAVHGRGGDGTGPALAWLLSRNTLPTWRALCRPLSSLTLRYPHCLGAQWRGMAAHALSQLLPPVPELPRDPLTGGAAQM